MNCKEDRLHDMFLNNKAKEIADLKEQLQTFKQANEEKNAFLEKLGISAGGEFRRISYYIDQFRNENKKLREQLQQKEQEKLMLQIENANLKAALSIGAQHEQHT